MTPNQGEIVEVGIECHDDEVMVFSKLPDFSIGRILQPLNPKLGGFFEVRLNLLYEAKRDILIE